MLTREGISLDLMHIIEGVLNVNITVALYVTFWSCLYIFVANPSLSESGNAAKYSCAEREESKEGVCVLPYITFYI